MVVPLANHSERLAEGSKEPLQVRKSGRTRPSRQALENQWLQVGLHQVKPRDVHFRILSPHTRSERGTLSDSSVALDLLDASETEGSKREDERNTNFLGLTVTLCF